MPITPFHLGPGVFAKAIIPSWFSLSAFTFTQIVIDSELAYFYFIQQAPYHRILHSFIGASALLLVCFIVAKPICQFWLRIWNKLVAAGAHSRLYVDHEISYRSVAIGSVFGVYSHIFLDSLVTAELQPLYPWSTGNIFYGSTNLVLFHFVLLVMATIGIFWLLIMVLTNKFRN